VNIWGLIILPKRKKIVLKDEIRRKYIIHTRGVQKYTDPLVRGMLRVAKKVNSESTKKVGKAWVADKKRRFVDPFLEDPAKKRRKR
jgi:hypothetical protein